VDEMPIMGGHEKGTVVMQSINSIEDALNTPAKTEKKTIGNCLEDEVE
jgi:hypothetical protein